MYLAWDDPHWFMCRKLQSERPRYVTKTVSVIHPGRSDCRKPHQSNNQSIKQSI